MSDELYSNESQESNRSEESKESNRNEESKESNRNEEIKENFVNQEMDDNDRIQNNQDSEDLKSNAATYSFWAEQIAITSPGQRKYSDLNEQHSKDQSYSDPGNGGFYNSVENQEKQYNNHNTEYSNNIFNISSEDEDKRNKNKFKFFKKTVKFILSAAMFGLIAGAVFIGFNIAFYKINPSATPLSISFGDKFGSFAGDKLNFAPPSELDKAIATTTVSNDMIQQKTDITDVVEATMPSIVTITSTYTQSYNWFGEQYDEQNEGGGSGIIVGENDKELLIATNNHVVEGADPILVNFIDDSQVEAIIKGTDATADLAVISIDKSAISKETLAAIKIAKLGDSESVKVGQMAVAIGNALGYGQSVTVGYISAKDREVAVSDKTMVLLQTDAAINPGNSGGALLNINGEVIGINSVKYASSEVEGMGYAIPISRAMPIINELMSREILKEDEKGYLGVYINDVTEEIANMYSWPIGVYVTSTVEDGSAAKAGIISGDIITAVEGTEITASTQLREKVTSYREGSEIKVTVMRSVDGKYVEKEIIVTLGANPEAKEN